MGKTADLNRGPLHQDAATVATGLKHLNGEEALTGRELCAMLAGYVSTTKDFFVVFIELMLPARLCQTHPQDGFEILQRWLKSSAQGDESRIAMTPY